MSLLRIFMVLGIGLVCGGMVTPLWAQQDEPKPGLVVAEPDAFGQANDAYNQGNYAEAVVLYVAAIQDDPSYRKSYRNLARSYFWMEKYALAATFYGHYVQLASTADPVPSDIGAVSAERRLAISRSGEEPPDPSEPHRLTLNVLERELDEGRAYLPGGGGAWYAYQTLLRSGFAHPDLIAIRSRLARRLLDEFEALLLPEPRQITPMLELEDWNHQKARMAAAQSIANDPVLRDLISRRTLVVDAADALLQGPPDRATALCEKARSSNPDLRFLRWYEIVALIRAESLDRAAERLEELHTILAAEAPEQTGHADLLRGVLLQRTGEIGAASTIYLELLSRPDRSPTPAPTQPSNAQ